MIQDLDATIHNLIKTQAQPGSELGSAKFSFDIPDSKWSNELSKLTVNCYLYDVRQNLELSTAQPLVERHPDGARAAWRRAPVRIDCSYCLTAWSTASDDPALEEHRLLSQLLMVLLRNPSIPPSVLQRSLVDSIPPYPTVIASRQGIQDQSDFWGALNQPPRPCLNYVVTLAMRIDEVEMRRIVDEVDVEADHGSQAGPGGPIQ